MLLSIITYGQEGITFSKVIRVDSVGKAELFSTINDWFASTYNSANDVIQMADKEDGTIIGKGSMNYSFGKAVYGCYEGYINYTIKAYIKDNRYKIELSNFSHVGNGSACSLSNITTAEFYATTGMSKNYQNNVWKDLKTKIELFSNDIFESLNKKTKSVKSDW